MKQYNTIGCCGIDCGLCPRFVSQSDSACPGCGAPNFYDKHPSCGFLTCCVKNHRLEVCGDCDEYPCKRFDSEREGYDSFVTHKRVFFNQEQICKIGLKEFVNEQKRRIDILEHLITNFDNGRSKSFFCQTCTLIPIESLDKIIHQSKMIDNSFDIKEKNKVIREIILEIAEGLEIDLKLRKK